MEAVDALGWVMFAVVVGAMLLSALWLTRQWISGRLRHDDDEGVYAETTIARASSRYPAVFRHEATMAHLAGGREVWVDRSTRSAASQKYVAGAPAPASAKSVESSEISESENLSHVERRASARPAKKLTFSRV